MGVRVTSPATAEAQLIYEALGLNLSAVPYELSCPTSPPPKRQMGCLATLEHPGISIAHDFKPSKSGGGGHVVLPIPVGATEPFGVATAFGHVSLLNVLTDGTGEGQRVAMVSWLIDSSR